MKKLILAFLMLFPLLSHAQLTDGDDDFIEVKKYDDTTFFITDIDAYAEENNLEIITAENTNDVLLMVGDAATGYITDPQYQTILLVQKSGTKYTATELVDFNNPNLISTFTLLGRKVALIYDTEAYFSHINYPVTGYYTYHAEHVKIVTLDSFETLISLRLCEKMVSSYVTDIDEADTSIKFISDNIYVFEHDTFDISLKEEWYGFNYYIANDRMYLYSSDEKPEYETCTCKELTPAEFKNAKPAAYYDYDPKNKKWVKKIPTH